MSVGQTGQQHFVSAIYTRHGVWHGWVDERRITRANHWVGMGIRKIQITLRNDALRQNNRGIFN